ncbi:mycothiol system anti-sigma-R factor [Mumia flava]|uniref:Mycothiol system anti-sigma-R factor n=1 Tax=Mumia flava TaxID=1348852 RepID=A0A0B2BJP1_9ACTN|nr:mycothiol system anti-sigma-R factor [Mumia flava]PJJ56485.1 mycothiol system anti-sigma-R factor [Mumia flava]
MTDETAPPSDCQQALENLYLFLDHELPERSWDDIHAHIADCAPCLTAFDVERIVKELVARSCREKAPDVLRAKVVTSIRTSIVVRTTDPGTDA